MKKVSVKPVKVPPKGGKAMAKKQPPGKKTMIGGKNRAQKVSEDTPV
jgi:hypothetical protein